MSTTVTHRSVARFPGKGLGMAILGLALAAAIGYGVSTTGDEPADTGAVRSSVDGADQLILNRAAGLAAERQNLLNQATKGVGQASTPNMPTPNISGALPGYAVPELTRFASSMPTPSISGPLPDYAVPAQPSRIVDNPPFEFSTVIDPDFTGQAGVMREAWASYLGTGPVFRTDPFYRGQTDDLRRGWIDHALREDASEVRQQGPR